MLLRERFSDFYFSFMTHIKSKIENCLMLVENHKKSCFDFEVFLRLEEFARQEVAHFISLLFFVYISCPFL